MPQRPCTVKVSFADGIEMLFGNSYRDWDDQLQEFCGMSRPVRVPSSVVWSSFPWVSYGGLKWCQPDAIQAQLDEEGKGRQASEIVWGNLPANERSKFDKLTRQVSARSHRQQVMDADLVSK